MTTALTSDDSTSQIQSADVGGITYVTVSLGSFVA
jgi:hypothetical protein